MLFVIDPPAPPPLTVEQQADLQCLGLALGVDDWMRAQHPSSGDGRLTRIYLTRLKHSDPSRDWRTLAIRPGKDMLYGDFLGLMNTCSVRAKPKRR